MAQPMPMSVRISLASSLFCFVIAAAVVAYRAPRVYITIVNDTKRTFYAVGVGRDRDPSMETGLYDMPPDSKREFSYVVGLTASNAYILYASTSPDYSNRQNVGGTSIQAPLCRFRFEFQDDGMVRTKGGCLLP